MKIALGATAMGLLMAGSGLRAAETEPVPLSPGASIPVHQSPRDEWVVPTVAVFDANGDERPDLFVGRQNATDVLLLNDVRVGWRLATLEDSETPLYAVLAVDLNRDFLSDLVAARGDGLYGYVNRGGGRLGPGQRIAAPAAMVPLETAALSAGDLNDDGWVDLLLTEVGADDRSRTRVLLSGGAGHGSVPSFAAAAEVGDRGRVTASLLADLNGDRREEVVLAGPGSALRILEYSVEGGLVNHRLDAAPRASHVSAGDYDNDGDLDVLALVEGRLRLWRNNGAFAFSDVSRETGVASARTGRQATWTDVDNDGYLDIVASPRQWLRQVTSGRFSPSHFALAGAAQPPLGHAIMVDFDRNGFPDQLNVGDDGRLALLNNAGNDVYHWVAVRLRGQGNRATLGSRVTLKTQDGRTITRHQILDHAAPGNLQDELLMGIGRRTELASLEIAWNSGKFTRIDNPLIDRWIGFVEPKSDRQVALAHPMLEAVKHRKARQPDLMCR